MGNKLIDFTTQHDASRGRNSKAGGIESDSISYTPENTNDHVLCQAVLHLSGAYKKMIEEKQILNCNEDTYDR